LTSFDKPEFIKAHKQKKKTIILNQKVVIFIGYDSFTKLKVSIRKENRQKIRYFQRFL